jgi:hypothetical protein
MPTWFAKFSEHAKPMFLSYMSKYIGMRSLTALTISTLGARPMEDAISAMTVTTVKKTSWPRNNGALRKED